MKRYLHRLADEVFDVAIIGGGILGAWVALDAALRGLSVALVERSDFASGTSSNSLKVIHGGLRYLQSGDIKRMRESIRERSVLMRIAPHLIHPLPVTIPLYGRGVRGPEAMRAALGITDVIGLNRNQALDQVHHLPRGRILSRGECLEQLPEIDTDDLTGGAVWYDAQVYDSERLVIAVLQSAVAAGAVVVNYVEAERLLIRADRIAGIHARDMLSDAPVSIRARVVVNAAGPWAAPFSLRHGAAETANRYRLSRAFNLAVPRIFADTAVGIPSKGKNGGRGRMFFATPWRDLTLIGTAHLPNNGDPDHFSIAGSEITEFLDDFNEAYPAASIERKDIIYVHTGLLPAIAQRTANDGASVAEHPLVVRDGRHGGPAGLITVTNVKYTTSRLVASRAVDAVADELAAALPPAKTDSVPVHGGEDLDSGVWTERHGLGSRVLQHLTQSYGTATTQVLDYARIDPTLAEPIDRGSVTIKAQVLHAVREEMALRLADVVYRRTGLGTGACLSDRAVHVVAEIMGAELGWDSRRMATELDSVGHIRERSGMSAIGG